MLFGGLGMTEMLAEGFRWYGPKDEARREGIRQAGAESVFTSLHEIPYGELWGKDAIMERVRELGDHGVRWSAVERLPVSEDLQPARAA